MHRSEAKTPLADQSLPESKAPMLYEHDPTAPLPLLGSHKKLSFRALSDIITALKTLHTEVPITLDILSLIKSEGDLLKLAYINPLFAKTILYTSPYIQRLITFDFVFHAAISQSPIINELVLLPCCVKLIDSPSNYLKIATSNTQLAINLLRLKDIAALARPVLRLIPFESTSKRYQFNHPEIKQQYLKKLNALDLHIAKPLSVEGKEEKKATALSSKDKMDLRLKVQDRQQRFLAKTFPTIASYVNQMMFGESGYYAKGKVTFSTDSDSAGDFFTFPSNPTVAPAFGAAFAHQLFSIRNNLIMKGELSSEAPFNILECGAGNGDLCYHILNTIEKMAALNLRWRELHERVHYHIIERSSALIERQRKRNKLFEDKLVLINADARNLKVAFPELKESKPHMAAVISNELIDVFPPHEVVRLKNEFRIGFVMPSIKIKDLLRLCHISIEDWNSYRSDPFKKTHPKHEAIVKYQQYLAKHLNYINSSHERIFTTLPLSTDSTLFLSREDFYKLHKMASNELKTEADAPTECFFKFTKFYLNSQYVPRVHHYIQENKIFFDKVPLNSPRYIMLGIKSYLKNVSEILIPGGEVITVDYGNTDELMIHQLRTYDGKIGFDIFKSPGKIDITLDISFSEVARAGKAVGLYPVFFGQQHQLLSKNRSDIPDSIVPASIHEKFIASSKTKTFYACVQRKESKSAASSSASIEPGRFSGCRRIVTEEESFNAYKDQTHYPIKVLSLVNRYAGRTHTIFNVITDYLIDPDKPLELDSDIKPFRSA